MRVEIKGNVYGMSRKEYKRFLKIASKAIPCGIYAAEKGSTAIMLKKHRVHHLTAFCPKLNTVLKVQP
jgi:hypothetical protein